MKCKSWILIDGGNDQAVCQKDINHTGKHKQYGVPEWTDEQNKMAEQWLDEW